MYTFQIRRKSVDFIFNKLTTFKKEPWKVCKDIFQKIVSWRKQIGNWGLKLCNRCMHEYFGYWAILATYLWQTEVGNIIISRQQVRKIANRKTSFWDCQRQKNHTTFFSKCCTASAFDSHFIDGLWGYDLAMVVVAGKAIYRELELAASSLLWGPKHINGHGLT